MTEPAPEWIYSSAPYVLAAAAALAVSRRSLLPRSAWGQILAVAGASSTVAGAAALLQWLVTPLLPRAGQPELIPALVLWAGVSTVSSWLLMLLSRPTRRDRVPRHVRQLAATLRTVALLLAAVTGVNAAVQAFWSTVPPVRRDFGDYPARVYPYAALFLVVLVAAVYLGLTVVRQREFAAELNDDPSQPDTPETDDVPKPQLSTFLWSFAIGAAVLVAFVWYPRIIVAIARWWADDPDRGTLGLPLAVALTVVASLLVGAVVLSLSVGLARWYLRKADALCDPRIAIAPSTSTVSSWESMGGLDSLGPGGRRFIFSVRTADDIEHVTGAEKPSSPLRLYVGLKPRWGLRRWTPREQVNRMMQEIERTEALERDHLILAAPTGSGGINQAAIETFEYLTEGDCATLVLRYAALPSVLALLLGQTGRRHYRELHRRLAMTLAERRRNDEKVPKVSFYGESLGALVSQNAFVHDEAVFGAGSPEKLGVERAIWVGTPRVSRWLQTPDLGAKYKVTVVKSQNDPLDPADDARVYLLSHDNDPVGYLDGGTLIGPVEAKTSVLKLDLPLRPWLPAVTFFQLVADTFGALGDRPVRFRGYAHDYRADVTRVVRTALGADSRLTDEVFSKVQQALQKNDEERESGARNEETTAADVKTMVATELRIHGVGGEAPELTLNHASVFQVAGDDLAGFYRPGSREAPATEPALERREAYSWGALAENFWQRVLWVILLPFALVNVASWMATPDHAHRVRRTAGAMAAVHRLLALVLSLAVMVTLWGVGTYIVGWHCSETGRCVAGDGLFQGGIPVPLTSVKLSIPEAPGWRAVTSVVPALLAMLVLYATGRQSRMRFENWPLLTRRAVSRPAATTATALHRLADPHFWAGSVAVARLQKVHGAAALALLAGVLAYPAHLAGMPGAGWIVVGAAGLVTICVLAVVPQRLVGRRQADETSSGARPNDAAEVALQGLVTAAGALLGTAAVTVGLWWRTAAPLTDCSQQPCRLTPLPGFDQVFGGVYAAQFGLLALLLLLLLTGGRQRRTHDMTAGYEPVLWGFGPLVTAAMSVLLGAALGTGLLLFSSRAALDWRTRNTGVEVPPAVRIGAVAVTAALVVAVLAVLLLRVVSSSLAGLYRPAVIAEYGRGGPTGAPADVVSTAQAAAVARRRTQVARRWTTGWIVDNAPNAALAALAFAVLGLVVAASKITDDSAPATFSMWFVATLTATIIAFTYGAVRARRRSPIAVLWDVTSFWPRAAHPFAPPCFAERAVPELVHRMESLLTRPDRGDFPYHSENLVVVGYSQGSVLTAAALAQLDPRFLDRVRLVTCGAPLRRLYARFFPAYFNERTLAARAGEGCLQVLSSKHRWQNLYRPSDAIGSYVHKEVPPGRPSVADDSVDRRLRDPASFVPLHGDLALPPVRAHGGYLNDPKLIGTVNDIIENLQPAPAPKKDHARAIVTVAMTVKNDTGPGSSNGGPPTPHLLIGPWRRVGQILRLVVARFLAPATGPALRSRRNFPRGPGQ
ncbi:alpha/beta-hydrolase family protein [Actinoplanes sp. NPDC049548]|uniref:alpha/beta-hydrolase family protein n=1 Tax=Actinoplanes sp. NPDC049548 TaxID=3155152 RepID=UPI003434849D